jgi:hypothetical protein
MPIRHLIPWIRSPDVTMPRIVEIDNSKVYIVKWIPKDQDVVIDHSTDSGDPSLAMQFAVNALQLSPKRIWIEGAKGEIHADHEAILQHLYRSANQPAVTLPTPNGQHGPRPVDTVLSQLDVRLEEPKLVDFDRPPREDERLISLEVELPIDKPSTVSQHTVQVNQVPANQDQQEQVNMVLTEIQGLLAEPAPAQIQRGNSKVADFDERPAVETKSPNSLTPDDIQCKQNEPKMSDSIAQEIEALLGISTSSEAR